MARGIRIVPIDVEERLAAFRTGLEEAGIAQRLTPEELKTQLDAMRQVLVNAQTTSTDGVTTREVVGRGVLGIGRVEHVTHRRPLRMGFAFPPILDTEGRLDPEATAIRSRLIREVSQHRFEGRPPLVSRAVVWVVARRARSAARTRPDSYAAHDEAMRAALQRLRDTGPRDLDATD